MKNPVLIQQPMMVEVSQNSPSTESTKPIQVALTLPCAKPMEMQISIKLNGTVQSSQQ